jgi:hypothetical protein
MEIHFNKYIVNSEVDFVDNGVDKIKASISLIVNVVGANNFNEMVIPVEVINLNSETGDDMDAKRLSECMLIVNNY